MIFGYGEVFFEYCNYIKLDFYVKDVWGILVFYIDCLWGENEVVMVVDMGEIMDELFDVVGVEVYCFLDMFYMLVVGKNVCIFEENMDFLVLGLFLYEVGGVCMGVLFKEFVFNLNNQVWGCFNFFVIDGVCWLSIGWQKLIFMEMVVIVCVCIFIVEEVKRGNF